MKPLLFSPSPRNIKAVLDRWEVLHFDHLIEKFRKPLDAYQNARNFFLEHDYTHIVVCPDDLEVTNEAIETLVADIALYGFEVVSGMCNIDETQPDTYNIQPIGCDYTKDHPNVHKGAWYMKNEEPILPETTILQVGFSGFACQMISRKTIEKTSFEGASNAKQGNFDWQFTRECAKLGIPIYVDTRVNLWHRRLEQWAEAKAFKNGAIHQNDGKSEFRNNSLNFS